MTSRQAQAGRTLRRTARAMICAAGLVTVPMAFAADWQALVVAQSGPGGESAASDGDIASGTLSDGGMGRVAVLHDVPLGTLHEALARAVRARQVVLYYAGPLSRDGMALQLGDGVMPVQSVLQRMADSGVGRVVLLIEDCAAGDGRPSGLVTPDTPDGMELLVVASAGPGGACPTGGQRLTDRLSAARDAGRPVSLQKVLGGLWMRRQFDTPVQLFAPDGQPPAPAKSPAPARAMPDAPSTPATAPAGPAHPDMQHAGPQPTARPLGRDLPVPSILIGVLMRPDAGQDSHATGTPSEISYADPQTRRRLRRDEPGLFERLVTSGAFDPPDALLARTLQTELQRMHCYTSAVDGIWGGGSRSSVQRYFDQVSGVAPVSLDPVVDLFRQIILRDDVTCPEPATAPGAEPARALRTGTPASTTTRAQAPAQDRTPGPKINPDLLLGPVR